MSIIRVSREDFIRRYESIETKITVIKALKKWDKFLQSKSLIEADLFNSLRSDTGNQKYILLDQLSRFPVPQVWFTYIKAWIKYNDISLDNDKIKEYVRWPKKMKEREKGIDRDIVRQFLENLNPFYRIVVLVAAVTGMRIRSELINKMEWAWIDFESDPIKITIPARYTKMKQERITFATPQVKEELLKLKANSKTNLVFPKSYDAFYNHLCIIRDKLGLTERKMNGMFQFKPHRFRGFTENKLSKIIGEEYAHAITGHGNYLNQYFAGGTTDVEAGNDYKKAEKDLTIEFRPREYEPRETIPEPVPDIDRTQTKPDIPA